MHTTHARRCPSAGVVIIAFLVASILASAFTFLIGLPCHPMHSSDLPGGSRYCCLLFFLFSFVLSSLGFRFEVTQGTQSGAAKGNRRRSVSRLTFFGKTFCQLCRCRAAHTRNADTVDRLWDRVRSSTAIAGDPHTEFQLCYLVAFGSLITVSVYHAPNLKTDARMKAGATPALYD